MTHSKHDKKLLTHSHSYKVLSTVDYINILSTDPTSRLSPNYSYLFWSNLLIQPQIIHSDNRFLKFILSINTVKRLCKAKPETCDTLLPNLGKSKKLLGKEIKRYNISKGPGIGKFDGTGTNYFWGCLFWTFKIPAKGFKNHKF